MHPSETVRLGIIAGMAGGLAEIAWIAFYGTLTGRDSAQLARSISAVATAVIPSTVSISAPVAFGITIHMIAAVALGVALILLWRQLSVRSQRAVDEYAFMLAALAIVWLLIFSSCYRWPVHISLTSIAASSTSFPIPSALARSFCLGWLLLQLYGIARAIDWPWGTSEGE